jgi:selenocysteine-specific translation elongation factor
MLAEMARGRGLELIVAATKADKLRRAERTAATRRFESKGMMPIMCSANDGEGIEELRRRIVALSETPFARANP